MQYEGVVDIFQSIRILRTQRPGMVQTEVIFICYIIIIYIIKLYIYVLYNCIHVKNGVFIVECCLIVALKTRKTCGDCNKII